MTFSFRSINCILFIFGLSRFVAIIYQYVNSLATELMSPLIVYQPPGLLETIQATSQHLTLLCSTCNQPQQMRLGNCNLAAQDTTDLVCNSSISCRLLLWIHGALASRKEPADFPKLKYLINETLFHQSLTILICKSWLHNGH